MPPRAARKPSSSRRTLYIAGGALLLLVLFLYLRRRSSSPSSNSTTGTSSTPSSDQSTAQQPSGGASNTPGNLPASLVQQPDTLQQQVQQTDTTTAESPQAIASAPMYTLTASNAPTPANVTYNPVAYNPSTYSSVYSPVVGGIPSTPTGTGGGYVAPSSYLIGRLGLTPSTVSPVDTGLVTGHGAVG